MRTEKRLLDFHDIDACARAHLVRAAFGVGFGGMHDDTRKRTANIATRQSTRVDAHNP